MPKNKKGNMTETTSSGRHSLPVHPHQRLPAQVYTSNKPPPHFLQGILRAAVGLHPQNKTQMNWNDEALKLSVASACIK